MTTENKNAGVVWRPQPRQMEFMRRPEPEALYGGAAGGGKSDALVIEALRQVHIPHYRALILRKTYPQLSDLVDKSQSYYRRAFPEAQYNATSHVWVFPSGAKIYFGSMQYTKDRTNYQGKAFDFIGFDELTHFEWEEYSYMMSRNRPTGPGTRVYLRATTNPGGIGHGWVKARFITPAPPGTRMVQLVDVATHYQSHYAEELTYTVSDLETYYQGNKSSFDVASYESLYFKGTADSTKDDDGNTVEPTDEENAAAKAKAESDAAAVLARVQDGEALEDVAKDYESASYTSTDAGSNNGSDVANWVFDSARKAGDSAVVASDSNCYVVVFRSVGRQEYATKDVRHILFKVDESALDSEAETYEADLQAAKDAAKAAAEDALAQWKAGDATESDFATLAATKSTDSGTASNGGLVSNMRKGAYVQPFEDWSFDPSRQSGDTDIIKSEYGYHVMYFVSSTPIWETYAKSGWVNEKTNAFIKKLAEDHPMEVDYSAIKLGYLNLGA